MKLLVVVTVCVLAAAACTQAAGPASPEPPTTTPATAPPATAAASLAPSPSPGQCMDARSYALLTSPNADWEVIGQDEREAIAQALDAYDFSGEFDPSVAPQIGVHVDDTIQRLRDPAEERPINIPEVALAVIRSCGGDGGQVPIAPVGMTVTFSIGPPPGREAHLAYTLHWCPVRDWLAGNPSAVFDSTPDEVVPGLDDPTTWEAAGRVLAIHDDVPTDWFFSVRTPAGKETIDQLDARWDSRTGAPMSAVISGLVATFTTEFSSPVIPGYGGKLGKGIPGTVTVSCA